MSTAARQEPLALAERAHALVQTKPQQAHAMAERALELSRLQGDAEARVAALHALGFARGRLGDPRALRTLQSAVRAGERDGYPRRAALARRNVAFHLAYAGKTQRAVQEIDAARAGLTGIDRARTEVFRIAVFHLAGRSEAALAESAAALSVLRRSGDALWEARLLYNRGSALSELGAAGPARRDLERARDLYAALGADAAVADAQIALARLRLLEGDSLDCLSDLDAVDLSTLSDWAACWMFLSRAEAFVALRLLPEAMDDVRRFVETSALAEAGDSVNKARLEAARLALLAHDPATAASLAATATRSFAARGQTSFAAAAALVSVGAAIERRAVSPSTIRAGRRAAAALDAGGWVLQGLRGRLLVAWAAATLGSSPLARRELAAAQALERRGTVADRIELRHVDALVRVGSGDHAGAERSLRAGLRLLEDHRAALGAGELRATASTLGEGLARQGLRIAFDSGKADKVLAWAERLRANALRLPPARPPTDPQLRAAQAELRRVAARAREAEESGTPVRGLAARQTELEAAIRARTRRTRGLGSSPASLPRPREAGRALGARVLVEYVELDGTLRALTLAGERLTLHELGVGEIAGELEWLRFALGRLAGRASAAQRKAAYASATAAAWELDRLLVEPLRPALGDAPLVIVPTGALHALPWGALPSLRGRPFVVAPSLSTWLDAEARPRSRRRKTIVIAGPRLRHARPEIREIAPLLGATVLDGRAATVSAVLAALDGAAFAHVACHGRFRSDSPLFSSLELADGPLTALDLQRLRRPPDVLVLSSCDLALSDRHPGDELLGFSAALLATGTRTIVASVVPVPDAAARRLMLAFHRAHAAGASPAAALALAQSTLHGGSAALAGFVCIGTG